MERRKFTREFKLEAVRLIRDRGVSFAQASQDLSVHQSQLRSWVTAFADDPQHAFPGQGQMKPAPGARSQCSHSALFIRSRAYLLSQGPLCDRELSPWLQVVQHAYLSFRRRL